MYEFNILATHCLNKLRTNLKKWKIEPMLAAIPYEIAVDTAKAVDTAILLHVYSKNAVDLQYLLA